MQTIQLSISRQFSSIWPIERTLSGATTPGQSGPGSNGNKGVLCIPQSSSITGINLTIWLFRVISGHLWGGLTPLQRCSQCILQPWLTGPWRCECEWINYLHRKFVCGEGLCGTSHNFSDGLITKKISGIVPQIPLNNFPQVLNPEFFLSLIGQLY